MCSGAWRRRGGADDERRRPLATGDGAQGRARAFTATPVSSAAAQYALTTTAAAGDAAATTAAGATRYHRHRATTAATSPPHDITTSFTTAVAAALERTRSDAPGDLMHDVGRTATVLVVVDAAVTAVVVSADGHLARLAMKGPWGGGGVERPPIPQSNMHVLDFING